jgi:hypothetical protein
MTNPSSISKEKLSGSTDGRGIKVVATATPGTTIHTAKAGTTTNEFDEIWLWCYNGDTANREVTIEFGGVTVPDDNIKLTIPFKAGLLLVVPGLILQNSSVVKAFGATTNVLVIQGFVNRISN